jgi:FtsJ-like methyltransferase
MNIAFSAILYLLAAPKTNRGTKGRQRYDPKRGNAKVVLNDEGNQTVEPLPPPPPQTDPAGPFPTYFTCRHTYEDTLIEELVRTMPTVQASSPYPGLVRIENAFIQGFFEPIYALQALPECRIVEVPESIKGLARAVTEIQEFQEQLAHAQKGSLSIHALVPGMCKGQKDPILQRRSSLIAETTHEILKHQYPAARKGEGQSGEDWLLQILLLAPDVVAVSLSKCQRIPYFPSCVWPNPAYPLGLAKVDISMKMPSSAYRKLLEAFACWGAKPAPGNIVVDLGASPGGWTAASLLLCQCRVVAVDRSDLDPRMMNNLLVKFVKGDAFTYKPDKQADWMISDVIAYPERVSELLDVWCGERLAKHMIVTVKFQGSTPSWDALDTAIKVARDHGYYARAKHFFNNKNEVTLMVQGKDPLLFTERPMEAMYDVTWPKP